MGSQRTRFWSGKPCQAGSDDLVNNYDPPRGGTLSSNTDLLSDHIVDNCFRRSPGFSGACADRLGSSVRCPAKLRVDRPPHPDTLFSRGSLSRPARGDSVSRKPVMRRLAHVRKQGSCRGLFEVELAAERSAQAEPTVERLNTESKCCYQDGVKSTRHPFREPFRGSKDRTRPFAAAGSDRRAGSPLGDQTTERRASPSQAAPLFTGLSPLREPADRSRVRQEPCAMTALSRENPERQAPSPPDVVKSRRHPRADARSPWAVPICRGLAAP